MVETFEKRFAQKTGAKYAVAFSSGTSALIAACGAAGLEKGDRLITSTLSFIASANCGRFFAAGVDLTDVDEYTLNITPKHIADKIKKSTRVIIPVHYAGLPVDMREIRKIAGKHKLTVIEDAAHGLGADYRNTTIGDCRFSDMCCFSFHPTKLITTGEGGMVTTNSKVYYNQLRTFRNHGIEKSGKLNKWEYDCSRLSFNWRLSDLHSGLGLAQLEQMDKFLKKRRQIAKYYDKRFAKYDQLITPATVDDRSHAYHLYVLRFETSRLSISQKQIYEYLKSKNIIPQLHYRPIHRHTIYKRPVKDFPNAEKAYKSMFSIPMHPGLTGQQYEYVADVICRMVEERTR